MTRDDDFIGHLEGYLDEYEGSTPLPESVRDVVRAQLPRTKQIGPVGGLMRNIYMNSSMESPARWGLLAAVVVGVVIIGGALVFGGGASIGDSRSPTPSLESESPSLESDPAESVNPSPGHALLPRQRALEPGSYQLADGFPVTITFDVPEGFWSCSSSPLEQAVCTDFGGAPGSPGLAFLVIDNVVADPCDPSKQLLEPPVGPSVDDLVAALSAIPGFEATAAEDVTISGYSGQRLQLTAPMNPGGCELSTWAIGPAANRVGPGEVNDLRILDVNGTRVVITTAHVGDTAAGLPAVEQIVDSIQIEAP